MLIANPEVSVVNSHASAITPVLLGTVVKGHEADGVLLDVPDTAPAEQKRNSFAPLDPENWSEVQVVEPPPSPNGVEALVFPSILINEKSVVVVFLSSTHLAKDS